MYQHSNGCRSCLESRFFRHSLDDIPAFFVIDADPWTVFCSLLQRSRLESI